MVKVKQIEIKNRTYYFYNDIINLKNVDSNLLKIGKKHYKETNIYYIGYIKMEFNSDDDLPLNKPLKFRPMTITFKSVIEEGGQFYLSQL